MNMLFRVSAIAVVLSVGVSAWAHDDEKPKDSPAAAWPAEIYRPTKMPDRICVSWTANPATSFSVNWRTDTSVKTAVAEIAPAEGGPDFTRKAVRLTAKSTPFKSNLGEAHYHQVDFEKLEPKSKYLYRVGDGTNWSEWSQVETASDQVEPFTFVYFGDAQNSIKSHWSRVVRQAFRDASRAAFFVHAGDLVNSAQSDAEWGEWFYSGGFIHRSIPAVAAPGNHEMTKQTDADGTVRRVVTPHWFAGFAFAENGPESLAETCYYIDYQGTRLIQLNSNQQYEEQARWLEEVLSDEGPQWRIVTMHHPIYSSAVGRDNQKLRELWQPIFDKYNVDLVLQGHDHTYARSKPTRFRPGSLAELNQPTGVNQQDAGGTVYVVSVSGPKMYNVEKQSFMERFAARTQLYQVIRVEADVLKYRAMDATGKLVDGFELHKRPGMPNEMVNTVEGEAALSD